MQNPRFRTDLVSKPVEEDGQRFVDVTDPDSGKTFRFYEVEYAVACAMNGDRDVVDLVDWARSELGLEPSPNELETVITTLDDLGYLMSNGAGLVDDLALGSPGRSPMDASGSAPPAPEQVELGSPGRSPMGLPPTPDRPEPANLELGAAGSASDSAPVPAFTPPPSAAAAPPAASDDLSTNLGEHLSIGTDDVKEAVRQSKIMEAVPVPDELLQDMEQQQRSSQPAPQPAPGAAPLEMPGRGPAPMPEPMPKVVEPPPPKPKGLNITVILLVVLLVVAVGLAAYYFLVYAKSDATEGTKRPRGASVDEPNPAAKKPDQVVATLTAGEVTETNLIAPKDGEIVWVEAAGTEVVAGAIVAKYDKFESAAKKLATAVQSRDRYKAKLEEATEADNKRKMAKAAANVERKNGDIAEFQAEAEKNVVKSDKAGVVSPLVEAGTNVKANQEIVKLAVATGPSAMFEAPDTAKHEVGDKVEIASKQDPSLTAVCDVTKIEGKNVSLSCPTDSGFEKGAAVIVKLGP